jgi:hypothetical protein
MASGSYSRMTMSGLSNGASISRVV